jgi:hypothetical protein
MFALFHRFTTLIVSSIGVVLALAKTGAVLGRVSSSSVRLQWTGVTSGYMAMLLLLLLMLVDLGTGGVIGCGFLCVLELQAQTLPGGHEGTGLCHVAKGKWGMFTIWVGGCPSLKPESAVVLVPQENAEAK